jgi:cellulose synthase operon protein C
MASTPSSPPAPALPGTAAEFVTSAPGGAEVSRAGVTLRPPEWDRRPPMSAGSVELAESLRTPAMARRTGSAEYASLKAKLGEARRTKDRRAEREAAAVLGRWLAERGIELDTAVLLARRALSLEEDAALRAELSGWLVGMGEHSLVAADIRRQVEGRRGVGLARDWMRVGELLARAGDAGAAANALRSAADAEPQSPAALEVLGMLSVWAPGQVSPDVGAAAFGEAALRRARQHEGEASFEDTLRAFDLSPSDEGSAEALAAALSSRARMGAADEVLRASAAARGEGGRSVHRRRAREALSLGDLPRAVGASLDAGLDAVIAGPDAALYDDVLARTGLYEQLAARLEVRAERGAAARGQAARGGGYVELARLCAGPLASVDRALDAWVEALAADPGCGEAKAALRAHAASMRDQGPLVEGLLRGSESATGGPEARLACLRELLQVAEDSLADPALALYAVEGLAGAGAIEESSLRSARTRLSARVALQNDAVAQAEALLARAKRDGDQATRIEALRRLVSVLRGRPREVARFLEVLREMLLVLPEERGTWQMLERAAMRSHGPELVERRALLEQAYRDRLAAPSLSRSELVRARLGLCALSRRRGDRAAALREAAPLLTQASSHRGAASMVATLAALENERVLRAESLAQLGAPLSPPLRSVLLACASQTCLDAGDRPRARALAEQACQADSTLPRAVQALSSALWGGRDRVTAAALERTAGVLVPNSSLCQELSGTLEQLGELSSSLDWTRRWLALRPGDPTAASALLRRASLLGDAHRLADAIAWVLAMPAPGEPIAGSLQVALRALVGLDRAAGAAATRRAADVLGVRSREAREMLLACARAADDAALTSLLLERWVASSAAPDEKPQALIDLADSRRKQGDGLGEARALSRALREGAPATEALSRLRSMPAQGSPDAALARLEALAEALAESGPSQAGEASMAFRDVGAARWDWAGDPAGAIRAWVKAAELDPRRGPGRMVRDLFAFGGSERALEELLAFAAQKKEPHEAALVHALAALAAFEASQPLQAFTAAERAVLLDPARTEALGIAEKTAEVVGDPARLERLYTALAGAAKGRFGRRAAHYRGARQLERRGSTDLAARHAIAAFEAVPSVGMTFVLMSRLSQRANLAAEAVASISRVADAARGDHERSIWLRRAAALSTSGEDGARMRVDILLRALHVHPTSQTVHDVAEALSTLVVSYGEAQDAAEMRFERAQRAALRRLSGPDGARIGISFAAAAVRVFGSGRVALAALTRALDADADVDEYANLLPEVERLAEAELEDPSRGFVERCKVLLTKPFANLGPAALRLAGAVAAARRDLPTATELLVAAARRAPDDNALVAEAERLLALTGDEPLRAQLHDAFPVARRLEALTFLAEEREQGGDLEGALEALQRAFAMEGVPAADRASLRARLRELYPRAGRRDALETMLEQELARHEASVEERVALSRELSPLLASRGFPDRAAEVLEAAIRLAPENTAMLAELVDVSRQAGDIPRMLSALAKLADASRDPEARKTSLRELAAGLEEHGQKEEAARRWSAVHALEPHARDALAALERLAMDRGDYETLSRVLASRVELGGDAEEVRVLRLRRAALLEQRLGRLEDARAELEALLEQTGDDASATRFLADLHERLGAPLRAGPLWMRAFRLQVDPRDRAELAVRAAQAFLRGGDYAQARASLDAALLLSRSERLLELRVELERRSENPRGLAESLDELAIASMDPPEKRADLLVEAANASLAAGEELAGLERAQRAARIAPTSPAAQLLARLLEYRGRGAGTPQEATHCIEELRRVSGRLTDEQIPLHAFLLAEALDVVHGGNAGMRELSARHAEIGAAPLIALGMAERLARMSSFQAALPFFDAALAGEIQGTRRRGSIALSAADAAFRTDDLERASRYLEEAAVDPATAHAARQRQATLAQAHRARSESLASAERRDLHDAAQRTSGPDRARALGQLARSMAGNPDERVEADRLLTDAIAIAAGDPVLQAELESDRALLRGSARRSSRPPAALSAPPPLPHEPAAEPVAPPRAASTPPPRRDDSVRPAGVLYPSGNSARPEAPAEAAPTTNIPLAPALPSIPPDHSQAEPEAPHHAEPASPGQEIERAPSVTPVTPGAPPAGLEAAGDEPSAPPEAAPMASGSSFPAAPAVADDRPPSAPPASSGSTRSPSSPPRPASAPPPPADAVAAARSAYLASPADRSLLEAIRDAAALDHNPSLVRAIEHVLAGFTPDAAPVPPPPLTAQREEPEFVHRLLQRGPSSPVTEALSLVWESASHLFRREAGTYGVTGLDRVSFGGVTVASRAYSSAARLLAAARTPLFQRRSSGPVSASVALLVPPAVVLAGEPRDETPELLYRIGAALIAAAPEFALLFGLPEGQLRMLLSAMIMSFGPTPPARGANPAVAQLAEGLWQTLPARAQRRMSELCGNPAEFAVEHALALARRTTRRAGLFLCGDLPAALREVVADERLALPGPIESFAALGDACEAHPHLLDLLDLATSAEYADARFRAPESRFLRGKAPSGAFKTSG